LGWREKLFKDIKIKYCIIAVLSSTFLAFSLLTVIISGQLIGIIQDFDINKFWRKKCKSCL